MGRARARTIMERKYSVVPLLDLIRG